jgi:hypothetical protein
MSTSTKYECSNRTDRSEDENQTDFQKLTPTGYIFLLSVDDAVRLTANGYLADAQLLRDRTSAPEELGK